LQQTARGNFVVVDSGFLWLDDISEEELPPVADQGLFRANYRRRITAEETTRYWCSDELCDSLMTLTQLKDHTQFYDR